jgi:AcrR family transcriptional regulator
MPAVAAFQRARKPEEREVRRETILRAAAELFDAGGEPSAGVNAIAARAGFTKSNLYRYFESREEVLLSLYLDEFARFLPRFEVAIAICPDEDTAAIAHAAAQCFLDFPRLSRLHAIRAPVLERNISEATIVALKQASNEQVMRMSFAIHDRLARATMEDCAWAMSMAMTLLAGLWPAAHPAERVAEVLERPEFAHLRLDPAQDLERAIHALLESIATGESWSGVR